MPLTALSAKNITKPGLHRDDGGLYLQLSDAGARSWIFRFMLNGKARAMGLGKFKDAAGDKNASKRGLSLKEAREARDAARKLLEQGIDPIEHRGTLRKMQRERAAIDNARQQTFKACAEAYVASFETSWRNDKHRAQWKSTLANYVYPVIGDVPVPDVDRAMVLKIIEPLWLTKTETASRIRGRIETVLDWAEAKELRSGKNPATWRYLKKLLPEKKKLKRVRHHPALPYADVPAFIRALRHHEGQSAKALEFTALTAARTGATIGATWDEIDLEARIWIVPPERTGAKIMEEDPRPRRVPLCNRAIEILSSLPREEGNPFVFIGAKAGRSLSNMAMLELMRELRPGYVPHGLRSSFKDWCAETTDYPDEVSEEALWHVISDEVKKAYRRSDLFNRRADLMAEWAAYCDGDPPVDRAQPGRAKLRIVA